MNSPLLLPDGRTLRCERARGYSLRKCGADGLVIEGSWGFNDLGGYFASEIPLLLGVEEALIRRLCDENTRASDQIVLFAIPSCLPQPVLRAAVFVPTELGNAYRKWATPHFGKPYRDFYYSVIHEALALLAGLGCRDIAIAGLRGFPEGHADIDLAAAEAVAHFAAAHPTLSRVISIGSGPDLTFGVNFFNENPGLIGQHRDIHRRVEMQGQITRLIIELPEKQQSTT